MKDLLIPICLLLLLAYVFDLTSARTRIPSVIFLLLMGWGLQSVTQWFGISLPDMSPLLPGLGTIGLILIVLEGALEVEINKERLGLLKKAFLGALLSALVLALVMSLLFQWEGGYALKTCLTYAIPLSIISSSIAIPTAKNLAPANRDFVVNESSLSDIIGILLFNFVAMREVIDGMAFVIFAADVVLMAIISVIAAVILGFLLRRINHPVKFVPIILLVILVYSFSSLYNLPSLLFILVFGLFLGNIPQIRKFRWAKKFNWDELTVQTKKLHELTGEIAFLVRALFFLLFGFTLQTGEILDPNTLIWSAGIVTLIFGVRALQLRLSGLPLAPLLFIAPRGLITILLFLSIPMGEVVPLVNKSLLTQIIVLTSLVMMIGMLTAPARPASEAPPQSGKV